MHVAELIGDLVVADPGTHALADDVEHALELHRVRDFRVFPDEDLLDDWLEAARHFAEDLAFHRNRAPAEEFLACVADHVFEHLHGGLAGARVGRHEDQPCAVGAFRRQFDALFRHLLA